MEVIVKKWGNSLAVLLPREFVKQHKLKPNQKVTLSLAKKEDLTWLWGMAKLDKSSQQLKDESREGWM
ncbi:AbrB/MazE/SpoVT family DNA-binding domain-containing protein [Candidatus Woesearchaeota archaeon]|nr:AbrB/MazE/SpoVT family DNA-binding domain-containing protein [Candidatus Woesearchaeota archaeon]HIH38587.1 AbrB/MazE/SpoVT family DNA-binding domain-containing protein [Candidatus Woesearchaeota archaeon]HIH48544.1 AbrB/MazE/SpoVT family DNA-binding domain-containing protein [Candidatus Woesearchaeota archaeon]HIJ02791.1 AbrB/MazE/SpoVT family DNA-binding domain-containing protein [Candidatus Woesearchaeota archaeon]